MTQWAQIDYRKSLMSEGDPAIVRDPQSAVIGASVGQGVRHVCRLVAESVCAGSALRIQ